MPDIKSENPMENIRKIQSEITETNAQNEGKSKFQIKHEKEKRSKYFVIKTSIIVLVLSLVGTFEYSQLMYCYDMPQMVLVMPIVGALAVILLNKLWFSVPFATIVLSVGYQIISGDEGVISDLRKNASGIFSIVIKILPVLLIFLCIGLVGGALFRFLFNKKKDKVLAVVMAIIGVVIVFVPYIFLYQNPIYPITARNELKSYAKAHCTDYAIHGMDVYFDLVTSKYKIKVTMADGVKRVFCYDASGKISDE